MEEVAKKAEQQEEKEKKVQEEEKKDAKDVDYWRQQAQQNDANARRERQSREDNEKAVEETKTQLTQKTSELDELKNKLQQQSEFQKMDKEIVDPAVASNIEVLQKQVEDLTGEFNKQRAEITQYKELETKRVQDRQYEEAIEAICKPLDDKYGSKYRSQARSLADTAVDEGAEKKPQTTLEAYLLHEKYYAQLSVKKDVKDTTTDKGKGTATVNTKQKTGTYKDVLAEMKARCKT